MIKQSLTESALLETRAAAGEAEAAVRLREGRDRWILPKVGVLSCLHFSIRAHRHQGVSLTFGSLPPAPLPGTAPSLGAAAAAAAAATGSDGGAHEADGEAVDWTRVERKPKTRGRSAKTSPALAPRDAPGGMRWPMGMAGLSVSLSFSSHDPRAALDDDTQFAFDDEQLTKPPSRPSAAPASADDSGGDSEFEDDALDKLIIVMQSPARPSRHHHHAGSAVCLFFVCL
jgi:hypothetical protein